MRTAGKTVLALVLAAAAATGCDQSLKEENAFLRDENEQLRRALDEQRERLAAEPATAQTPLGTTTPATPAPAATARTYVVKSGDTLSGISRAMYGSTAYWSRIYEANKAAIGPEPNRLKVGMKLTIPPLPAKPAARTASGGAIPEK